MYSVKDARYYLAVNKSGKVKLRVSFSVRKALAMGYCN